MLTSTRKLLIFLTCTLGRSSLSWHFFLTLNPCHFLSLDRIYQNIFTSLQQRSLTLVVSDPCSSTWAGTVVYCLCHLSSSGYLCAYSVYLYTEIPTWGMSYIVSYPWYLPCETCSTKAISFLPKRKIPTTQPHSEHHWQKDASYHRSLLAWEKEKPIVSFVMGQVKNGVEELVHKGT